MKKYYPVLHTIARYFLASIILMYAVAKIMGTQFSSSPSIWDKTVGELSGFELTWFFYGYSFWYGVFIASSQIIAAFLLFFRKTTRLGIVLYLSIMINILVLDLTYEIDGAIGMAITLTIIALFVFFAEFKSFYKFFIQEPPLHQETDRPNWMNKFSKVKYFYIPLLIAGLFALTYTLKKNIMTKNEFYGAWEPTNKNDWSRIYFQEASTFSIRGNNNFNEIYTGKYKIDKESKTIDFIAFDKDYISEADVLNPDTNRMEVVLSMDFQLKESYMTIRNDSLNIEMKKLK
ncbi:hypothetical protein [Flavobacterium sp.]|uniref:hypothetical protein n=1 Tax=Flavobacterium sp. TaxID=239 RepID=UPI003D28DD93